VSAITKKEQFMARTREPATAMVVETLWRIEHQNGSSKSSSSYIAMNMATATTN